MEALGDNSPFKTIEEGWSDWYGYSTEEGKLTIYSECCSAYIDNVDGLRVLMAALTELIEMKEDIEAFDEHERTDDGTRIDLDTIKGDYE